MIKTKFSKNNKQNCKDEYLILRCNKNEYLLCEFTTHKTSVTLIEIETLQSQTGKPLH